MNSITILFLSGMLVAALLASNERVSLSAPTEVFDQYGGGIRWEDEKARLDNFAIQLQQEQKYVGYILVFDAIGGCPGEAQARAIRAKKYVVEHRGVAWNRVIWRREGYREGVSTVLQPMLSETPLPFPFLHTAEGKDGVMSRSCKAKLQQIKSSRW